MSLQEYLKKKNESKEEVNNDDKVKELHVNDITGFELRGFKLDGFNKKVTNFIGDKQINLIFNNKHKAVFTEEILEAMIEELKIMKEALATEVTVMLEKALNSSRIVTTEVCIEQNKVNYDLGYKQGKIDGLAEAKKVQLDNLALARTLTKIFTDEEEDDIYEEYHLIGKYAELKKKINLRDLAEKYKVSYGTIRKTLERVDKRRDSEARN